MNLGRYQIDSEYKVHGIITEENPDGTGIFDPFEKANIPTWGVYCTSYEGLNDANKNYLKTMTLNKLKYQCELYWVFWFVTDDGNRELFFLSEEDGKKEAYQMLQIFNNLLEINVRKILDDVKKDLNVLGELKDE